MFAIPSSSSAGFHSDAYQDLLQKQLDIAKKNAATVDGLSMRADQDQKAQARDRVIEIKKQIEALRRMLLLFGGKDAKAVLQQLKTLAAQLKQAAGVLKTASDSGLPDVSAVPSDAGVPAAEAETADAYSEGRSAYAEQQASVEAEASGAYLPPAAPFDAQRAEDEKLLEYVTQALKSLRSSTERLVKQQQNER
ncbi:hypothetical protein [Duganella sp. BuS-21]|uniref:hypothetical protein n=1 Tax=Duganella sp. BuS-21 TaxID=2943848 RepID=UPI0035A6644A